MSNKFSWGKAALIVFVIAAGGFIYWNVSTVQQMKKQAALFEKMLEKEKEPAVAKEPPPAAPGKKWVPHGDHFHEVPIDAPDVWAGEPNAQIAAEFDFAVKLPTDAELPSYNERELAKLVYAASNELSDMQDKYETLTTSLREARSAISDEMKTGVIDSKSVWVKWGELSSQEREISRAYRLRRSERKEHLNRIQQYMGTLK
ncbi:hypothetical protein C6501_11880 [Candidatus Poribacteria bacterium]|nr:MAG: hypothetical protein C6501_11880 [Candidatus Poribacteria bacterium]